MKKEKIIKEYQNEVDNFNKKQPKKEKTMARQCK